MSNFVTAVFGEKPKVAGFKPLKPGEEQQKSLAGNISNFADIAKLGDLYTQYMTQQQNQLLPGYSDTLAAGQGGALDIINAGRGLIGGKIPQDILDQVNRNTAYQNYQGGFAGSGMGNANQARNLGLTSLDLMQRGADLIGRGGNSAQQWAQLASGDILNPQSQFLSPEFTANYDLQNRVLHQQALQNRYNISAAPNPVAKGVSDTIINLLGAYLGAGKGGGGGVAANSYSPAGGGGSYNYTPTYDQGDPYNYANYGMGPGGA